MLEAKFALRDFSGEPVSYWHAREIEVPKPHVEKTVGHHIVVVDRSGSMYGEMDDTKAMIEKVFTVEEFQDENLLVSLISYSSSGDVTLHFARTPITKVNQTNSPELTALRSIRASCLTCASQALELAAKQVGTETTCISLHTDGWFNDRNPAAEKKAIDALVGSLAALPNVMINCIAYRQSSDFNYLSTIANRMSGACVLAKSVREVYAALHDTTALLAGRVVPAIALAKEACEWQIAWNVSQKKLNGGACDLTVRGMKDDDTLRAFRFSALSPASFKALDVPLADDSRDGVALLAAYARTLLAEGQINNAKYAVCSMRLPHFLKAHYNALSSDRLAAFAVALDELVAELTTTETPFVRSEGFGLGELANRPSLVQLFATLNRFRGEYRVHMPTFLADYKRRSVQRINGSRDDTGAFTPFAYDLVEADENPLCLVGSFDVNTAEATINMQTRRPGKLVKGDETVTEVAGEPLDLTLFRQYTLVGDGAVLAPVLPIAVASKALDAKLTELGFLPPGAHDADEVYSIVLGDYPVVPLAAGTLQPPTREQLVGYAALLVERKIIEAVLPPNAAREWTPEQVAELKAHGLTPALGFSPPTTTPYADKDAAIAAGHIDSYTRYKVSYGTDAATDLRTALWSANEYLARRFDVDGAKKPKFADLAAAKSVTVKELSARTKLTPLDTLVMPVFEQCILGDAIHKAPETDLRARLANVQRTIDTMEDKMASIALVLGSTGLVPEHWGAAVVSGEALAERHPDMDMPKGHKDGTFFEIDGVYIGIHPEVAWYTVSK
jgi:hypothetical protein